MVATQKPALLRTVQNWIKGLDRSDSTRTSVHVYRVKYGDARQIARVLTDMFGGGSSSGGLLDGADNQIAPGSGSSASASDRLSMNGNSPSSSSGGFGARAGTGTGSNGTSGFGAPAAAAPAGANLGSLDRNGTGSGGGQPLMQGVRITA